MRRCLAILTPLAALAAIAVVGSAQAQAPTSKLGLVAKLQLCHTGATPDQRYAVFVGQMPALAGTQRMAMRFDLYQRTTGPGFTKLAVPKFGVWQKSAAGQSGFIFQKRVDELVAPALYRAVISFKWYGAGGKVQRTQQLTSKTCTQPDPRPNLSIGRVTGARGAVKGTLDYSIVVRNQGLGDAGPFGLLLTVNGAAAPEQTVSGLAAGSKTPVLVTAPACKAGSSITIQVDPQNQVAESNEADNTLTRACP
jgi:hypothetical protein